MKKIAPGLVIFLGLSGAWSGFSVAKADGVSTASAVAAISQSFEKDIRLLVQRSCTACHDSNAKPEGFLGHLPGFKDLEWKHIREASLVLDFSQPFPDWSKQVVDPVFYLDQISAAISKKAMPPADFRIFHHLDGRLLKAAEKQKIIDWAAESKTLLAQAEGLPASAAQFVQSRCLGCHNPVKHSGDFVMAVSDDQLTIPGGQSEAGNAYVTAGDPNSSAIYLVLLADPTARKGESLMPKGLDPVSDQERNLVYEWIKAQSLAH